MAVALPNRVCRRDTCSGGFMAKHAPQRIQSTNLAHSHFMRPTAVALAVTACFNSPVLANPTAPTVVNGTASFATAGNILNITNSHNAIINWGSFSIGVNELTRFIQPSALSAVLNRVTGQDPSAILGALQSNGRVFLLNPNGIVFGSGAQINVAGLVASTLNLSNDDFLNNRMKFTDGVGAGSVVNNGSITGGSVYLVGNAVTNNGLIASPNGEVVLAAGNSVELVNPGTPNLRVEIVAPDNEARNLGTISAEAGRIGIYAGLITNSGTLNASGAVSEGGKILLKATRNTTLDAGSQTTASGTTGGTISIQSGDTTLVAGDIAATGSTGNGGTVHVLGDKVGLIDVASVDASGAAGGGTVLVGGDYQGKNPDVQNAYRAYVGPNAKIKADAITTGNGGKVVVWSDDATRFYGNISARGGVMGGNGGLVEVSGKRWLDYNGLVDTRAPKGLTGTLLLDPSDITIDNVAGDTGSFDGDPFYLNGTTPSHIQWATIAAQLVNSNAIISTSAGSVGTDAGNITIAGNSPDLNSPNTLDLRANNNIVVNGSITNTGVLNTGTGNIKMYAGYNDNVATPGVNYGVGSITLNAPINTLGEIHLIAGGSIDQNAPGSLTAQKLLASSLGGPVNLANEAVNNMVGTIAGSAIGMFAFKNSGNLTIGSVGGVNGITVNPGAGRNVTVNVDVTGGQLTVSQPVYAYGGDGSEGQAGGNAAITLTSSSSMQINSSVHANGGLGGSGSYGGNGGNATTTVQSTGGNVLIENSSVYANGGSGYYYSSTGNGGTGVVNIGSAGSIAITDAYIYASGGYAAGYASSAYGGTGTGGNGLVLVSAGGGLTVSNSELSANGGTAGYTSGQGGAAGLTMLAGGNIQFEGAEGSVYGGASNAVGGDAGILMASTGGNIILDSSYYYDTLSAVGGGNTPGMKSVVVAAAGNVSLINGAGIYSSGTVGLGGANVSLDNAYVYANSSASVGATGSLSLANGSSFVGSGNAYITTGSNVSVDNSYLVGNPDVFMTVGGVVNMNNGGTIEAGAPTTIHLTFPMLTSGGFFVNGIEGVVFDSVTGTGFRADGSEAILGTNLLVTYGGGSALNIPTDVLIVAMGESTKPPDPEKDKNVFKEIEDNKKKDAPVCR